MLKEGLMRHIFFKNLFSWVFLSVKGYSPEKAYEIVEEWERTGQIKLLQKSKKLQTQSKDEFMQIFDFPMNLRKL